VQATRQTVFMITHDVDEAILLADKILLMSNGPRAAIAEDRREHHAARPHPPRRSPRPPVYRIRNHLVDFLINRSKRIQSGAANRAAQPTTVRPGSPHQGRSGEGRGQRHQPQILKGEAT